MTSRFDRRILIRAAVATLVLGGTGYYADAKMGGGDADRTFYGSVDVRSVNLGFRSAGRVAEVLMEEVTAVTAGQLLVRLDAEPYRRQFAQCRTTDLRLCEHHVAAPAIFAVPPSPHTNSRSSTLPSLRTARPSSLLERRGAVTTCGL
jgi:multidrug resistance efflux pump